MSNKNTGGFTSPRTFEYQYKKILKEAHLEPINYHALRHTFATRCIECGVDIKSLSEILGHANVSITLNTYVHSSIELKRLQLEKIYQLPCPLDAFTDNGWTVKNDSIGTLGAWNDESGVTIAKGDYRVYLTMINLSDFETYTKNCAVSAVSIEGNYFKGAPKDVAQLPGGTTLWSTVEEVQDLYKDFNPYDGTYSTSFTYENQDYTIKVRYSFAKEEKYGTFEIKNEHWDY